MKISVGATPFIRGFSLLLVISTDFRSTHFPLGSEAD
jgi:hypothetical protein